MRTAAEILTRELKGWNLGNAQDSFCLSDPGSGAGETEWGNPKTTRELLRIIRERGFNLIRIPVTWFEAMDGNTVREEKLGRVREIVDWSLDLGFTVIVNTHHENSWMFNHDPDAPKGGMLSVLPGYDDQESDRRDSVDRAVEVRFAALWRQIADGFRGYPDRLIFEGMNEPRIENGEQEWEGGTEAIRKKVNRLNRVFVETVRAIPDHRERVLLITTSGAVATETALRDLIVPRDPYIGVSLHIYLPNEFCFLSSGDNSVKLWQSDSNREPAGSFARIKETLTDKGVAVALTEFGLILRPEEEEVVRYVTEFLGRAWEQNIPCVWWDNNYTDHPGDSFALIKRETFEWTRPEVCAAVLGERSQ